MVVELAKDVYWVGVVDWAIRKFHGQELSTHRGTSYNSYLITDEETVLVDTVWGPFAEQLMRNISEVVDPAKISVVVANHAEVDHSGGLPTVMRHTPNARVVVSQRGRESVQGHYHQPWAFEAVKTGDTIDVGQNRLQFIEAPMLHWPHSMFTYLAGKNILMSNDAFGQHYATAFPFNDQVNQEELYQEALKYYANILTPFSSLVTKKIEEVVSLALPIDMIAPSHGIIWREDPIQIVRKYQQWAKQEPDKSAVILYDTMWEGTRLMAEAVAKGLAAARLPHKVFHMGVADRNDVIAEVFKAKAIIVGCPTFNQGILPTLAPILEDLKGLKFQNKIGAAFGSYGWSGEAVKVIEEHLGRCKITLVDQGVRARWQPTADDLAACMELGQKVARAASA